MIKGQSRVLAKILFVIACLVSIAFLFMPLLLIMVNTSRYLETYGLIPIIGFVIAIWGWCRILNSMKNKESAYYIWQGLKWLLLGVLIVHSPVLVRSCNEVFEAQHISKEIETPIEFKTFSKYGFSFKYPKDFNVLEAGLLEKEVSENSGVVQVSVPSEEIIKAFRVGWLTTLDINLEDAFEAGWLELEDSLARYELREFVETTKAGHRMLYQYYSYTTTEGDKRYGIVAALYCDKRQKFFTLQTINNTISDKQDILDDFKNYLDSFVCH